MKAYQASPQGLTLCLDLMTQADIPPAVQCPLIDATRQVRSRIAYANM